ncbi:histone acetyltransferase [Brevundimonas sp. Leaf363]|uniref:GNAT family N-acetyltransferase n=1 Tax=Brevundimonas sp. Leaf363 TaxID=1736353 RepID=UPI000700DE67|nr:GNAT family N-acetyltransferase [Brevundimonas sp. Leaf363]KQS56397.1 histone acetyltransferase [Brevundimonas sp. Leaf363]
MFSVRKDDLTHPAVQALLAHHHAVMHADSPPGHAFALNLDGLKSPDITVWSAWDRDDLCAIGALRRLDDGSGEIKSMRTHADQLRRGAAAAILTTILDHARDNELSRVSLETGSGPSFEPALALYRRAGFTSGGPFGGYEKSDFNQFLHLDL